MIILQWNFWWRNIIKVCISPYHLVLDVNKLKIAVIILQWNFATKNEKRNTRGLTTLDMGVFRTWIIISSPSKNLFIFIWDLLCYISHLVLLEYVESEQFVMTSFYLPFRASHVIFLTVRAYVAVTLWLFNGFYLLLWRKIFHLSLFIFPVNQYNG